MGICRRGVIGEDIAHGGAVGEVECAATMRGHIDSLGGERLDSGQRLPDQRNPVGLGGGT
jgi:hypothetical protein